jgi:hypothetical protein
MALGEARRIGQAQNMRTRRERLPAGTQPYDPLNALRVGALAGAGLGGLIGILLSWLTPWLVVAGAGLGGFLGYRREKRRIEEGLR